MSRLEGQVALITGVGSGIGRAAAQLFYDAGATVFGVDRNAEDWGMVPESGHKSEQQSGHNRVQLYQANLAHEQACIQAVQTCIQQFGRIDILYNNAGISVIAPFTQTNTAMLAEVMAVNFQSVYWMCQQVLPLMQVQGGGVVINTASELAVVAQPLYTAYCASKGAVLALTRALALEYAQDNIRINALCPGPIDTPMLQQEFDQAEQPDQAKAAGIETMPIGRLGRPEEIAQVALFLAADAPALLQGATLLVDGAKTIL